MFNLEKQCDNSNLENLGEKEEEFHVSYKTISLLCSWGGK